MMKNDSHDFEQFMKQREDASRAFMGMRKGTARILARREAVLILDVHFAFSGPVGKPIPCWASILGGNERERVG